MVIEYEFESSSLYLEMMPIFPLAIASENFSSVFSFSNILEYDIFPSIFILNLLKLISFLKG